MQIYYGIKENKIDVTEICMNRLVTNGYIIIPQSENSRAHYFTDPLYCVKKFIFIKHDNILTEYDDSTSIYIDLSSNTATTTPPEEILMLNTDYKLNVIHGKLNLNHGSFDAELPEQKLAVQYLTGKETILEIGGNIGRNSLVISYILGKENESNLVVLESHPDIFPQLKENRDLNTMNFHIENSALSKRNLIQKQWDTIVSDTVLEGYTKVNTITYDELMAKYNLKFDTLIIDCEGAFYYIIHDMPEILNGVKLIIVENDYRDITHKQYVDKILLENKFYVDYQEAGGWYHPCYYNFYEVWKRSSN